MGEISKLTSSELVQDYRNPDAGNELLLATVKEIPWAAGEFARQAWEHPGETALHVAKSAGMGLAFGGALGYLIPARGPCALIIGAAFTIPAVTGAYGRVNRAYLDAQHANANIEFLAKNLAFDTVSGSADFAVGMAAGFAGAELGRQLAMSNTSFGRFAQSSQRLVLKAENQTMTGMRSLFGGREGSSAKPGFEVNLREPNAKVEDLSLGKLSFLERRQTLLSNRLDQYAAADPQMKMYYGSLHGHSVYSDGMGTPKELYARARKEGLDFTAITDHSHTAARSGVPPGDPRYPGQQKVPTVAENPAYYTDTIKAAAEASKNGDFAGLYGVELGTIGKVGSKGQSGVNHMNVLQTETFFQSVKTQRPVLSRMIDPLRAMFKARIPEAPLEPPPVVKINDGNIKMLVDHLDKITDATGGRPVIQLNHPRFAADESPSLPAKVRGRDYGQKSFASQKEWVDRFGKYASQMEILNGDAMVKGANGQISSIRANEVDYAGYLDKGLKISPTYGRDFHYGNPGGTKSATGVMASSLDQAAILDALRARRTIATTNRENLTGSMVVNDVHPMGSVLDQAAVPDLRLKVKIGGKVSPDAEYTALLWGDKKLGDGKLAEVLQTKTLTGAELKAAGNSISFDPVRQTLGARGAYYVEVQRVPTAAELASQFARNDIAGLNLLPGAPSSRIPVIKHSESGGTFDPMAKFLGERMWTAPVWSEPLAGANHSLLIRTFVGAGSSLLSP